MRNAGTRGVRFARMDRRFIVVPLAGAALVFATGCNHDVVVADATDCHGLAEADCVYPDVIQATVQSGPAGQNADGQLLIWGGFGMARARIDAQVTCLHVDGNTAIIGWAGTVSGYLGRYYKAGLEQVRDLGPRDSGQDTFEGSSTQISETPVPGPTTCSSFPGPFPTSDGHPSRNEQGNVLVYDAPVGPDGVRGALGR